MRSVHNLKKNALFNKYARRRARSMMRDMKERGEKDFVDLQDLYALQLVKDKDKKCKIKPVEIEDTGEIDPPADEGEFSIEEARELRVANLKGEGNEWVENFIEEYNANVNTEEDEEDFDALAAAAIAERDDEVRRKAHRNAIKAEEERQRQFVEKKAADEAAKREEHQKIWDRYLVEQANMTENRDAAPVVEDYTKRTIDTLTHTGEELPHVYTVDEEVADIYAALGYAPPAPRTANKPDKREDSAKKDNPQMQQSAEPRQPIVRKKRNVNPARKVKFASETPQSIDKEELGDPEPTEAEILALIEEESAAKPRADGTPLQKPRAISENWDESLRPRVERIPLMHRFGQIGARENGVSVAELYESMAHSAHVCPVCGHTFYPREWQGAQPIVCAKCLDVPLEDIETVPNRYEESVATIKRGITA